MSQMTRRDVSQWSGALQETVEKTAAIAGLLESTAARVEGFSTHTFLNQRLGDNGSATTARRQRLGESNNSSN
jgi:hypothetical protein